VAKNDKRGKSIADSSTQRSAAKRKAKAEPDDDDDDEVEEVIAAAAATRKRTPRRSATTAKKVSYVDKGSDEDVVHLDSSGEDNKSDEESREKTIEEVEDSKPKKRATTNKTTIARDGSVASKERMDTGVSINDEEEENEASNMNSDCDEEDFKPKGKTKTKKPAAKTAAKTAARVKKVSTVVAKNGNAAQKIMDDDARISDNRESNSESSNLGKREQKEPPTTKTKKGKASALSKPSPGVKHVAENGTDHVNEVKDKKGTQTTARKLTPRRSASKASNVSYADEGSDVDLANNYSKEEEESADNGTSNGKDMVKKKAVVKPATKAADKAKKGTTAVAKKATVSKRSAQTKGSSVTIESHSNKNGDGGGDAAKSTSKEDTTKLGNANDTSTPTRRSDGNPSVSKSPIVRGRRKKNSPSPKKSPVGKENDLNLDDDPFNFL